MITIFSIIKPTAGRFHSWVNSNVGVIKKPNNKIDIEEIKVVEKQPNNLIMETQIKNSFDKITLIKIFKGILITATGTAGLYILDALGTIDFGSSVTPFIALLIPILVNVIKEFMKGEKRPQQ